jgi:hypothetical protein
MYVLACSQARVMAAAVLPLNLVHWYERRAKLHFLRLQGGYMEHQSMLLALPLALSLETAWSVAAWFAVSMAVLAWHLLQ